VCGSFGDDGRNDVFRRVLEIKRIGLATVCRCVSAVNLLRLLVTC
jgi:hypothetical protein